MVGLGQACLDLLGRVPRYPSVDEKCEVEELIFQGGGPVATALVALARWGFPVASADASLIPSRLDWDFFAIVGG